MSLLKYKNKLVGQAINLKNLFQKKVKKQFEGYNSINTKKEKGLSHQNDSTKPEESTDWKVL